TLFAAVEGEPPFRREGQLQTLHAVLTEQVPPALHAGPVRPVIEGLLTRDPAQRPTAEQARELLEQALAEAAARGGDPQVTAPVDVEPTADALPVPPLPSPSPAPGPSPSPSPSPASGPSPSPSPSPASSPAPLPAPALALSPSGSPVAPVQTATPVQRGEALISSRSSGSWTGASA
ncbi:MAG TPA: hypothetical protein VEV65_14025, partial [Kineosporiaceae bacterium]|nr:hypothetical protein [Kineosporiaceae bacterium]